ncbi:MAG: uL15m family ribosomal protein, partial [Flavobacteriaceae bacterium]|nr:uL15m family ribosomal protein [Flavobacteriaceae bacterium]
VSPQTLVELGVVKRNDLVKILGRGELKAGLKVTAHKFSTSAKEAIEKVGGEVITL